MNQFIAWMQCSKGATAIEYGFIIMGVALAIVAAIFALGDDLSSLMNTMASKANSAASNV